MDKNINLMGANGVNKMAVNVEKMKNEMPFLIQYVQMVANLRKKSYDAHIKEGFTPEQALSLCNKTFLE